MSYLYYTMDIETIYLIVGVFIIPSLMLIVLQRLFKNKSYEEVIAEQRQHSNALFSSQPKPKVKDKKQKKALKKSKEKKPSSEVTTDEIGEETSDLAEHTEESAKEEVDCTAMVKTEVSKTNHHTHVEFKEATTVIEEPLKEVKRKPRRESVKPILVNRDSSSELIRDVIEVPQTNHFEESHPKDEFELFNAHNSNSQHAKEEKNSAENNNKKTKKQAADKKIKHQVNEIISKKEKEKVEAPIQPLPQPSKEMSIEEVKEVKEQLVAPVVQNGISAVPAKDKKKKKSEFNVLTQNHEKSALNVNLSQMITLVRKADMSKQDVQTLIDVLLNKQHDAPSIIDEWSEGKGDPMQKLKKQLAEKTQLVTELQESLIGAQNKMREVRADQQGERSQLLQAARDYQEKLNHLKHEKLQFDKQVLSLNHKCQQMQETANEEANKNRKLMEEFKALQIQHQQYMQQMEHNIEGLQYEFANKQMQINKQSIQYQAELEQAHKDMQLKDNRCASDRQQFNKELEMWREKLQDLEKRKNQEIQVLHQQLDEAKMEIAKVSNELRMIQENNSAMLREKEIEIAKQISLNNSNLQENHKLMEELQKVRDAKTNGSIEQGKQHQLIINQLNMELKNVINQLESSNMNSQQKTIELEELRNKNNDLRKKNWKVMEALNAAENRVRTSLNSQTKLLTQLGEIPPPVDPIEARTKFLKRVFPSIVSISANLSEEQWDKAVHEAVRDYVLATATPAPAPTLPASHSKIEDDAELLKLRAENTNYRKIIDQSEAILCKLQTHVEEEQIRWGRELKIKEDSISRLSEELELKEEELRQKGESLNQAIITNSHCTNGPTAGLEFKNKDNVVTN
ncbi:kinectin isoform X3 [Atheta coriaria]|uniref:kinectin isoform X3 n=1 Tax=Dalotia coriaria TaxID=877792 RepID=UPI0031F3AF8C